MGSMNASQCDLAEQGFAGSVSDYSSSGGQSTFTLTLATTHFCEHDWYERRHRLAAAGYRALRLDEHRQWSDPRSERTWRVPHVRHTNSEPVRADVRRLTLMRDPHHQLSVCKGESLCPMWC